MLYQVSDQQSYIAIASDLYGFKCSLQHKGQSKFSLFATWYYPAWVDNA
jgi:hypothetical protein